MTRFLTSFYFLLFFCLAFVITKVNGQDHCPNATSLCANNTIAATTLSATVSAGDPALSCGDGLLNNNVWFTVSAISNGTCTVTVAKVDNNPGLAMEAYTGTCGSLVTTGFCNSVNGPNGSMNLTFPVAAGTTYYIMVDGQNGNQEAFTILATSITGSILGRPQPNFIPAKLEGCIPLSDSLMRYPTVLNGGTNITYQWRIDGGSYINASANDTTVVFNTIGTHSVDLKICNNECGCASATQYIDAKSFSASITPPANICIGGAADFFGNTVYLPSGNSADADVGQWTWYFGDPASGSNDTSYLQNPTHTFVGAGPSFVVTLIVSNNDPDCGTDTVKTIVTAQPQPTVTAGANQTVCDLADAHLTATTTNATTPVSYQWNPSGVIVFSCDTCQLTDAQGLQSVSSPYNITIHIQDANGCTADSSIIVFVTPKPTVDLQADSVCRYTPVQLRDSITAGTGPFTFSWTPTSGLDDPTLQNPTATVGATTTYCVLVRDTIGCPSDTTCVTVNVYTSSLLIGSPKALCASDPNLNTTFTVSGANANSIYEWYLSPDYALIDSASLDSSTIRASFPTGVATLYNFTCIVTDGTTGCKDTVNIAYPVVSGLTMTLTPSVTICQGDTATLVATGAITYNWTATPSYAFADSTLDTQVVWPNVTTTFSVQGNIGSCTEILSDTVTVNSKPIMHVLSDSTICPNYPTKIFAIIDAGGTPPFTFTWAPAGGLDSTDVYDPIATINSTATYCAFLTDSNNCKSDTHCLTLTVNPLLTVLAAPTTKCATDSNMQTVFTVNGASSGSTYQWYLSPDYSLITGSNVDSSSVIATFPQGIVAAYHFVILVIDSATGCQDTLFKSFSVTSGLSMAVSGRNKICLGQSTTLIASGATTYSWTTSPAYAFGNPNAASQTISPVVTTSFTIAGTTGTCNQEIVDVVTVNAQPTASVAPVPLFCGCDTVTLDGSLSTGGNQYKWISIGGNSVDSSDKPIATSFICHSDSFMLIVMDTTTSCGDSLTVAANQKANPDATASIMPNKICGGTSSAVLLDGTGSDTNSGTTYLWTSNNPNAIFADSSSISTTVTVDTATVFNLIVTDSAGCDSTFSVTLNSSPKLTVTAGADQTICEGDTAHLIAVTSVSPVSYLWSAIFPFSCDTCDSTDLIGLPAGGPYAVQISVTDTNGCTADSSLNINVNSAPTVAVNNDTTVCAYSSVQLNATVTSPNPSPFTYLWTPSYNVNNNTIYNPVATVVADTSYCVVVKDSLGCSSASTCVNLHIFPKPTISASPSTLCASNPILQSTITVGNASSGSIYSWVLSPDYPLIDSASVDSSVVRPTFPPGVVATYNFAAIVIDSATACQDTVFQSISVTAGLSMAVAGNNKICFGQSTTLTASGAIAYSWTAIPAYAFSNPNLDTETVSPTDTTIFYIAGTTGGCNQVITDTVIVNPQPVAVASAIPLACGCKRDTLDGSLSTGGNIYQWISTGGNTIDSANQSIATSFICSSDSFLLVVMDIATGCSDTTSVNANQRPKPAATDTIVPSKICGGVSTNITLDGTGSDANTGTTYLWTSNNPKASFADSSALITTSTVDTATIFFLTVTDSAGCDSIFSYTLAVFPTLSVNAGSDKTICEGDSALLVANSSVSPVSYQWSSLFSFSCDTCDSTYALGLPAGGPYTMQISVTDTNGCTADSLVNVNVSQGPIVTITNDTTVCAYSSVQLTASGNPTGYSYLWNISSTTANLNNDTIANPIANVADSSASFCVIIKDSIGCSSPTACVSINIFPKPIITASPPALCQENPILRTMFTDSAAGAGSTYSWSLSLNYALIDSANSDSSSVWATFPTNTVGVYNFTSIVKDGVTGCTDTVSTSFTVIASPKDSLVGPNKICMNDTAIYSITPATGIINWVVNAGTITQGQGTDSIYVIWNIAGTDTVTVTDTDILTGCTGTQSIIVTIDSLPVTTIVSHPDSVCLNSTTTYIASTHAGSVYNWTVQAGGGTIIGGNTLDSVSIQWDSVGVWVINVNETDTITGCIGTFVQDTVTVLLAPSSPTINGDSTVCEGDTMEIYTVPFTNGSIYNWAVSTGTLVSGQGSDTIYVNWPSHGLQTITVVETTQYGCTSLAGILSIEVDTMPVASVLPASATICPNDSLTISGSVNITNGTIHWTTSGNGTFNDTTIASPVYHPGTLDTVVTLTMVLTSPSCGDSTVQISLTVNPSPIIAINALNNDSICFGDSVTLVATGALTYLWSTGETKDSILVKPTITTTFTVVGTNSFGCSTSDSIKITVVSLPIISSVSGRDSVCINDSAIYVANPSSGNYIWTISGGTILSGQNTDSVNVLWNTLGTDTIFITNGNLLGCTSSDTIFVFIKSPPVTSPVTGPDSVCANDTLIYFVTNHPGSTYNWIAPGGSIIGSNSTDSILVTWASSGVEYIYVSETNGGCNSALVSDTVLIFAAPITPVIQGDSSCVGDSAWYFVLPNSDVTFNWAVTGGNIVSGQGSDSILVLWTASGQDTVSITETSNYQCGSVFAMDIITVNAIPLITVIPHDTTICRNTSLQILGTANYATSHWTSTGTGTFNDTASGSPIYTPGLLDSGLVILSDVLTSPCGTDTANIQVTVLPSPVATLTANPSNTICKGDTTTLVATGGSTYLWSTGESSDSIVVNPIDTAFYWVSVTNSFNCSSLDSITVTVIPPAVANAGGNQTTCRTDSVLLNGTYANAGALVWSTLGDGSFTDSLTSKTVYIPGSSDIASDSVKLILKTTGAVTCRNASDTILIVFGGKPTAYAGRDTTLSGGPNSGATIPLNGTANPSDSVQWTTSGTGTFSPNDTSLTGTYTPTFDDYKRDSVIITLTAVGPCGTATSYFVIDFTPFIVPNIFTPYPNSPGYNDYFEIVSLPPGSTLKIWDRWGLLVYTSDNYQNDWDAHGLAADEFYYVVETKKRSYHGIVHVFR